MLVLQNGTSQNIKVTSVILEADPENPTMMKRFMCIYCGEMVGQFIGTDVIFIVPGETPGILPLMVRCKPCKTRYLINSIL